MGKQYKRFDIVKKIGVLDNGKNRLANIGSMVLFSDQPINQDISIKLELTSEMNEDGTTPILVFAKQNRQ